jgi:hypothetical protein
MDRSPLRSIHTLIFSHNHRIKLSRPYSVLQIGPSGRERYRQDQMGRMFMMTQGLAYPPCAGPQSDGLPSLYHLN